MSDSISRQNAIKAVCNAVCECDVSHYPDCDQIKYCDEIQVLISLPSADKPTGEWVRKYDKQINYYWYECNQCGEYRPRNVFGKEWSSPYCPNCGAKMGGDTE